MQASPYIKHIPGITDISEQQAMAEFLFVNSLVSKGEFLPPREGMLSKFFINMPPSFANRIIIGRDTSERIFIALDEDMASFIFPLDFGVVVNKEYFAFSVNAINSNFIIRLPLLPEYCNAIVTESVGEPLHLSAQPEQASEAADNFLAELEAEATEVNATENASGNEIAIYTFYKAYGSDFAFKKTPASKRSVPITIADAQLSIN